MDSKSTRSILLATTAVLACLLGSAAAGSFISQPAPRSNQPSGPSASASAPVDLVIAGAEGFTTLKVDARDQEASVISQDSPTAATSFVPGSMGVTSPTISPDGDSLIFASVTKRDMDLFESNRDGSDARNLTNTSDLRESGPALSPDGKTVAFERTDAVGKTQIVLLNMDSGITTELTKRDAVNAGPAWSPDGSQLAYFRRTSIGAELYAYDAVTGETRQLTSTPDLSESSPAFSPDSSRIAYVTQPEKSADAGSDSLASLTESRSLTVMDSTGQTTTLTEPGSVHEPAWINNNLLAFSRIEHPLSSVATVALDSRDIRTLCELVGFPTFAIHGQG